MADTNLVEIEIPFQGFYESVHDSEIDSALECAFQNDEGDVPEDLWDTIMDTDIDWKAIRKEYSENFVDAFAKEFDLDLTFTEMTSPQFYNFESDRIFCKIPKEQIDKIRKEVEAYPEYAETIEERFTSRDGFWSYYSADVKNEEWTRDELDQCQYLVLIELWIEHNGKANHMEYHEYDLLDNINAYEFGTVSDAIDAIQTKLDEKSKETVEVK